MTQAPTPGPPPASTPHPAPGPGAIPHDDRPTEALARLEALPVDDLDGTLALGEEAHRACQERLRDVEH